MFNLSSNNTDLTLRPKVVFLNSVFLFAGIVAFGMGFYRWQASAVMGAIDFIFTSCCFTLVYYLNRHQGRVEIISSIALLLSYGLFTAIYLLAPYNTTRIALFFLLSASAFFLKGKRVGFIWLIIILSTLVMGHYLPGFDTAYSHIDIVTACLYLLALFFIFLNYEIFKEKVNEVERDKDVLRLSEERFRAMVENGNDIISIISNAGVVHFISPSVKSVLGFEPGELLGKSINELIDPNEQPKAAAALANALAHPDGEALEQYEFRMKHKDGSYRDVEMVGRNMIENPMIGGIVLNGRDITKHKRLERELERHAHIDVLTGLNNRRYFFELAEQELARSKRYGAPLVVLMLDVDHFKLANDTYGHHVGDMVLQKLSEVCVQTLRAIDILGRIGGEEFAFLLPETLSGQALEVAERLRLAVAGATVILETGKSVHFTVSIGVAQLAATDTKIEDMLNRADIALYSAKSTGRDRVCCEGIQSGR
ncbi:MAG: diguanylate cyclase/phosphodiesterase with PAS/PAC sensor(s) [Gallionellaceae bacterium]|nr:MAG: diguanylate cyclase/phosphodiesterase with PAS/PAC sensor(s) [Gallionellaceae bacterium]